MLSPQEAEALILNLVQPLVDTEAVTLEVACDRILAAPVTSALDFPYWDNSAMDGYAVKFGDVQGCSAEQPAVLEIIEDIPAGVKSQRALQVGQAARIFTGAMLPEGADTIVMQENTQREGNQVRVLSCPDAPQAFVRKRGEFYQAGNPLLLPGIRLSAPEIAVLATAQCTQLKVYRRPRVAIFSTGDELVMPDCPLQPGQIVDSNQYALAAFVAENSGIPLCLGIVRDRRDLLAQKMSEAISAADIVLSTGGVSVGEYDYVEQLLEQLGGTLHVRSVAVKPGKPLTVATFANGCLYFGIPGNPVSALVSCWRFVQPALKKLSGLAGAWHPSFLKARSRDRLHADGKRETYLWGRLQAIAGRYEFQLASGSHSSGNLINLAGTNALAVLPVGTTTVPSGDEVEVMLIGN